MKPSELKHEKLVELLGKCIKQAVIRSDEYKVFCEAILLAVEDDSDAQDELILSAFEWLKSDFLEQQKRSKEVEQVKSLLPEILAFMANSNGTKDNPN